MPTMVRPKGKPTEVALEVLGKTSKKKKKKKKNEQPEAVEALE